MQMYSGFDANNHVGILGSRFVISGVLISKGNKEEAERLLREAVAKTRSVAGPKSDQTQAQLADLFTFYSVQKRNSEALKTLDEVLDCNLTSGETLSRSLTHSHCGPGWPQAADAVTVLNEIFEVLRNFESNDPLFAKVVLTTDGEPDVCSNCHRMRTFEKLAVVRTLRPRPTIPPPA